MIPTCSMGTSDELISRPGSRVRQKSTQENTRKRLLQFGKVLGLERMPAPGQSVLKEFWGPGRGTPGQ